MDNQGLHIVYIPQYRRKVRYGEVKEDDWDIIWCNLKMMPESVVCAFPGG